MPKVRPHAEILQPRCIKCAGIHPTDQCTKSLEIPAKCILRQGEHPANYKGCTAYKTLYKNKYPKPRVKDLTNQTLNPQKFTTPSISYAQVVQGNQSKAKIYVISANNHKLVFPIHKTRITRISNYGKQRVIPTYKLSNDSNQKL